MKFFKKKWVQIILCVFVLGFICIIGLKPKIILVGDELVEIPLGYEYTEKGAKAYSFYNNIDNKINIKGNVNNNKVGTYKIKYKVNYLGFEVTKERVVEIIDNELPIITLNGSKELKLCPETEYEEEGYKAIDNYDGDLTSEVIRYVLDDKITYRVKDKSGNIGLAKRNLKYIDDEAPNIKLNSGDITLYVGSTYNEPGYEVTDNCDKKVNDKVKIEGSVDTNTVGEYQIKYKASDVFNNESEVSRTVKVIPKPKNSKVIYLTFDDGPSATITPNILKILKEEDVKATFFVINHSESLDYLIKEEDKDGHAVALHSYTHNYKYVYESEDSYFQDLTDIGNKVKNLIGKDAHIIRFPGGSSNTVSKFNPGIMSRLAVETKNRGYIYFDWNVDSMDAGGARTKEDIYNNVTTHLNDGVNVVLMHDYENNYKTLDALRDIIKYGKENGYSFDKITEETKQIKHGINN